MRWRSGVWAPIAFLVVTAPAVPVVPHGVHAAGEPQAGQAKPAEKPKKTPAEKLDAPWPDAGTIEKRRKEAEALPLFQTHDPLAITIATNFGPVMADRDTDSTKTFPASLTVAGGEGSSVTIPVTLRTRGQLRLSSTVCTFPPLGVSFTKKEVKATPFDGQRELDMVTHCQDDDDYDQNVLKEYLAYRLYNLITPRSFRVRLAQVTYVEARSGRKLASRHAIFIEDEDDLARRLEGRALEFPRTAFNNYDGEALTTMAVFQYMIGNTDYSIWGLHNVKQVQTRSRPLYPIIWDFDVSGLVSPPYGAPDPRLGLASLRARLYRGPCRSLEAFEPTFAAFRAKEAESMALVRSLPGLRPFQRRLTEQFLTRFYDTLRSKEAMKKEFVDRCNTKAITI